MNGGTFQRVEHERAGKHNIEDEIISPNNDMFILHDSEGFERLNTSKYDAVREFIEGRRKQPKLEDQLHAIWCAVLRQSVIRPHPVLQISLVKRLCSSLVGQSIFERSDEEVLTQHNKHRLFFISRVV